MGNSMDGGACAGHRPLGEGGRWVRKGLARLGQQWSRRVGNRPCPWPWAPSGGSPKTLPGSVAPEQWRLRVHHDTGGLGEPCRGSEQEGSGCPSSARARHTRGQTWGPKARGELGFPGETVPAREGQLSPFSPWHSASLATLAKPAGRRSSSQGNNVYLEQSWISDEKRCLHDKTMKGKTGRFELPSGCGGGFRHTGPCVFGEQCPVCPGAAGAERI